MGCQELGKVHVECARKTRFENMGSASSFKFQASRVGERVIIIVEVTYCTQPYLECQQGAATDLNTCEPS